MTYSGYKRKSEVPLKPCKQCGVAIPIKGKISIRRYVEEVNYCSRLCSTRGTGPYRGFVRRGQERPTMRKDAKPKLETEKPDDEQEPILSLLKTASMKI